MKKALIAVIALGFTSQAVPALAQTFPTDDPVIRQMWELGMVNGQSAELAQTLLDSIGGRLTGTPPLDQGHDWLVHMYQSWGIEARKEQYGTWTGWRRGITHIDLITPRIRTLEGTLLGWSAGTDGTVTGDVILFPDVSSPEAFQQWLPQASGRFVLMQYPKLTCRPARQWQEYGQAGGGGRGGRGGRGGGAGPPSSYERLLMREDSLADLFTARLRAADGAQQGNPVNRLRAALEQAGAAGALHSNWSNETGINKVFTANTREMPSLDLSCEDYGLLFRLAENDQSPTIRVNAEAEFLGEVPQFNTIATIPGTELPDEYVLLSAHFDSFDSASGATDNGTGTITMLEAMRILKQAYPNPRRTIMVGHWAGEEQGLNGSRAFAADHPEIVNGLQALFNQDNGTGRVANISMQGLVNVAGHFGDWLSRIPQEISGHIDLNIPGSPGGGGSDYASFICAGAPAFGLSSLSWDYGTYTWHTNRDTYDKVVIDDLENNATLTAMLTYLASEDDRLDRARRVVNTWPQCRDGARSGPGGD
jgi:hypothetical protein